MKIDKFTEKAQEAIAATQDVAVRMGHQHVDGEHIHFALVTQEDGLISKFIGYMGLNVPMYAKDIETDWKFRGVREPSIGIYATRRLMKIHPC